jgi:uncharacterized protein YjiS (DUF1127 family)
MSCVSAFERPCGAGRRQLLAPGVEARLRARCWARLIALMLAWADRARQRRALAELDRRLLDDIGVPQAAAQAEARRPFWRG